MEILINNAYANNLKNIDARLPIGRVIGIAGVSGSGKSTLVKDIISAYGAQNYVLSLPMFERGIISDNSVVAVDSIDNLPATLMIDVINSVNNPNSTLSTITGIHSLLRELYSTYGEYHCPICNNEVKNDIYDIILYIDHFIFAEVKCDSQYKERVTAIKENFAIQKTEYYDKNDNLQSKKVTDGYVRLYLKVDPNKVKSAAQMLKKCANLSLRIMLAGNDDIVDTRIHTICEHCHAVLFRKSRGLFSFNVSSHDGGGACSNCSGSGRVMTCDAQTMFHRDIPMNDGGIPTITAKGIRYTTVTEKFLDAVAKKYDFSWSSTLNDLNEQQQNVILNGTEEAIAFTDRRGANGGKKTERFLGFKAYTVESYKAGKGVEVLCDYVQDEECPECKGNRLDKLTDWITYHGTTLRQLLSLNLHELGEKVESWITEASLGEKVILEQIKAKVKVYEDVGCDYLELNRQSTTLSGGELQRLRLCSFFSSNITNACILLDEPTTGLHQKDIEKLATLLHKLQSMGHTVILIEHNRQILFTCDYILELGPGGGSEGGEVQAGDWLEGTDNDCQKFEVLGSVASNNEQAVMVTPNSGLKTIKIDDFSALYIKHQSVAFPTNSLVVICGVSGSGKSTFVNHCLIPWLTSNAKELGIKRIDNLGQKNATRTVTSNVGSLLGINDKIAQLFVKESGLGKGNFLINSSEGKCSLCGGRGRIILEEGIEETCPSCEGRIFTDEVLQNKYQELNILEFLQTSVKQLISLVQEDKKLSKVFSLCEQIGVGYLSLARTSKTLSKGEIQRIKLVNVLSNAEKGNIYILDEPSKGLHPLDISKLLNIISEIIRSGNTVIAVEHNIDFISQCNYAIEFGPSSGKNGGKVVFSGSVEKLKSADTSTGIALQEKKIDIKNRKVTNQEIKDTNNIMLPVEGIVKKNVISYTNIPQKDIHKMFAYSNREYLNAAVPASAFFVEKPDDDDQLIGCKMPVIRPVGIGNTTFGRKARIVDALGLYNDISRYFLSMSVQDVSDKQSKLDVFSPGSSVGKCPVCKGNGELEQFDFKLAFSEGMLASSVEALLKNRTNYVLAKKCLKKNYGLDIFRLFEELSEEEKNVLLFGDKQRKFYDKGKEYYWEGLNRLVIKELRYMEDEKLSEMIRASKCMSTCKACQGVLLGKKYRNIDHSALGYGQFMKYSFNELIDIIKNDEKANSKLVNAVEIIVALGFGKYNLFTKVFNLNKEEQALIQLTAYLIHPIYGSIIAIDNSIIESCASAETVLKEMVQNCTVIINKGRGV